ncbi:uncharacterized protein LOC105663338 [Megachile rotundata]|uniref:uncharacterized protein LOC105663338 n=1 Tax=Megachile rotundata TaxID=143995 RepID=UPI000614BA8A|nr:PREDICTED: uncharacterized protein LOC105663338 [Megachile rotundata]
MSYMNQQNQENKYGQLARKLLKIATMSGSKVVFRRADQPSDTVTELLHEIGTTDRAIGDVTAEVMLTTLGKIPSEMYYLEDTTCSAKLTTPKSSLQQTHAYGHAVAATEETIRNGNEHGSHSSILIILLITLLVILLLCCISACLITKTKRRNNFFGRSDTECDPRCSGINQPLLDKISDCTNKTSISSLRN